MNKVILMGRLTRDPEVRYSQGTNPTAVCRYSLAVNRSYKRDGEPDTDFINCVTFGKNAEFVGKYLKKGTMIAVVGELRTGSYTDREGNKRFTTDVVVSEHYFAGGNAQQQDKQSSSNSDPDFAPAEQGYRPRSTSNQTSQRTSVQPQFANQSSRTADQFMPIDTELEGEDDLPF